MDMVRNHALPYSALTSSSLKNHTQPAHSTGNSVITTEHQQLDVLPVGIKHFRMNQTQSQSKRVLRIKTESLLLKKSSKAEDKSMKTLLQLFPTATQTLPFNFSVIYGLMGIVDGSETSPPKFTSTEHKNQGIVNPGYMVWQYKDQTVLGWIISSLSPAVVSTIYGLETSRLAWQALGARFAAPSTSRISLIKRKLQSLQQGSMQCQEFLDAVKALADELSVVGKPIEDSDLILSVLNGLNSSFHSFVTTYMLMAKEKSMSFSDFHAELLNFDLMQKFHSHNMQQEAGSYAFYGHKSVPKQGFRQNKPRFVPPYDNPNPIQNVEQNSTQTQTLEQNSTAPGTDLPSSASLPQPIEGIDNPITLPLSNSSLGINSNSSIEPASSLPSADEIPLPQLSSQSLLLKKSSKAEDKSMKTLLQLFPTATQTLPFNFSVT
ncbi:hypothetical protein DKX38_018604 [Salix brachista]|uniref:Retrotransposon gag domain-containing protein n=1 Tax=Salix brachista TaxID=2182728 RepID=A0A5N5KNG5_9ROSI|nr:hypothetical protein DKX38_018604 [Salix brachista]